MKNHRLFWEQMTHRSQQFKKLSKRIITTTVLAGTLILPWHTAAAEPSAFADFNGNGYMAFAIGNPSLNVHGLNHRLYSGLPTAAGTSQILHDMSRYGLQTHSYTPTFLYHHAPNSLNEYESGLAVDGDGFLTVFSW